MPVNPSQNKIYESYEMLHPDGTTMCFFNKKRALWYVDKGLAEFIDDEQKKIKLNFEPQGKGKSDSLYYTQKLSNHCVCCGEKENLNKHHVVPYVFRSRFPVEFKESNHHDVLPVCVDCHEEYEKHATDYKKELAQKAGTSLNEQTSEEEKYNKKIKSAQKLINNLTSELWEKIPIQRQEEIKLWAQRKEKDLPEKSQFWADVIMEKVNTEEKLFEFVVGWRKHFVEIMKPQFLFKNWDINFPLEKSNRALKKKI